MKSRVILLFQKQLVIGVAYVYGILFIGLPFFNINIDCHKTKMNSFEFINNWKSCR